MWNWLLEPVKGIAFSFTVRQLYVICPATAAVVIEVSGHPSTVSRRPHNAEAN